MTRCLECGAEVVDEPGPVHAYVPASAGCWALFGRVQADELARAWARSVWTSWTDRHQQIRDWIDRA